MKTLAVFALLVACAAADLYMQNPRGCNDRLNEANTDRNNANRLFDSQNNAQGGYCYGPTMTFYEGSQLTIEWTNQHGCGANPKLYCNMVFQYMCTSTSDSPYVSIRDGETTNTITNNLAGPTTTAADGGFLYGMHESYQSYQNCQTRNRNMGLYIADRAAVGGLTPNRASAIYDRQQNNGDQYGYECPEERDYYPYWAPTQWVDIAILTSNTDYCSFYQANSENVVGRGYCQPATGPVTDPSLVSVVAPNNPTDCTSLGATWVVAPSHNVGAPDCGVVPYSRENHLGNGITQPGFSNNYNWTLPRTGDLPCMSSTSGDCNCVLRMRYNVSSIESGFPSMSRPDSGFIDYNYNAGNSPVKNNPTIGVDGYNYTLAADTTQFGRTFQDRSYVFHIAARPSGVSSIARVFNLNVRGKRGNIVQTYPATEYDFVPQWLYTRVGDYVHFQWTGCDTNPAGNAGEGTDGTDRSNLVQMVTESSTKPASDAWIASNGGSVLFGDSNTRIYFAQLGQQNCLNYTQLKAKTNNVNADVQNCMKLNAASPYFNGGAIKMNSTGNFYYMNTRNHNFTNRDQKGALLVTPLLPTWAIAVVVVGSVLFVGAAAVAGAMFYAKSHPHSGVANIFSKM
jgi:hypothetical protein